MLFALGFFFSSWPNSKTLEWNMQESSVSLHLVSLSTGLTDSKIQTSPPRLSCGYATLKFCFSYNGSPLLCPSDTITTNLIYVYSAFTSPNSLSQYSSICTPLSTAPLPKQYLHSDGDASSTKLSYICSTLQVFQELFPFSPVQIIPTRIFLLYCSCYSLCHATF